jgi:hypothetical protein
MGEGHKHARVHVKFGQGVCVHLRPVEKEDLGIGL